ncbi:MAG: gliding motility protein GldN [Bacteroides sp.]|nr:gliding motility protein GldN [Bacteroides sp.]MCM1414002.1 gliding motility protein GldN [Bacteroides sp.]MCM1472303.1 gliding motility protein GldN [Bacteroides sp.]
MKSVKRMAVAIVAIMAMAMPSLAQDSGSKATMRRGSRSNNQDNTNTQVTQRMQSRLQTDPTSDAELSWMKVIYRSLDLNKDANAPLYFPEQPVDGNESLFRIIMRLLANNQLAVYEYLDGREVFTDEHRMKARDVLDRYHIYYTEARGSSDRNPKFEIHESDVPTTEVLSYYIIEKWEFDTRTNRMKTRVEAICPVLHRSDDYGMDAMKYPMFWVKYDDLRPYLSTQNIFTSDYNNLPSCTYDDYFQLGFYDGDIYKTRNLRNRSMRQIYADPDQVRRAQDSIQHELDTFEDKLWVPSLEELQAKSDKKAADEAEIEAAAEGDETVGEPEADKPKVATRRGKKSDDKPVKVKRGKTKAPKVKSSKSSGPTAPRRSVRDRKK